MKGIGASQVPSSSLLPENNPSTLFTGSGIEASINPVTQVQQINDTYQDETALIANLEMVVKVINEKGFNAKDLQNLHLRFIVS